MSIAGKIAFVSSADSKYYPLLREWIHSVRSFKETQDMDICVMDAGLSEEQIEMLTPLATMIVKPDWPYPLAPRKIRDKDFLKACVNRPFIPRLFPGYNVYIWMDSDTWLQDWDVVDLLIRGAQLKGLSIVPQVDRAYGKAMRLGWIGPIPWRPRSFYYSNARKAFSGTMARKLFPFPTINAGVFAMTGDAPHWSRWQELIGKALRKGKVFTAEQLTLGIMIYLEKFPAEFLPAWCNWLCSTPPLWDAVNRKFIEPYLPRRPIGIMHLSGVDDMRLDRSAGLDIRTTEDEEIFISYRYPHFDGLENEAVFHEPDMYDKNIKIGITNSYQAGETVRR